MNEPRTPRSVPDAASTAAAAAAARSATRPDRDDAGFHERVAARHGTPAFVFDPARLHDNARALLAHWDGAFPRSRLYYSYKTNYLPEVCGALHGLGIGADAVSGYELEHAARLAPGLPVVFNGPMKSEPELARALALGATINLDCVEEIDRLCALVAPERRAAVRLGVRVNPGGQLFDSDDASFVAAHLAAQARSKFGWSIDDGGAAMLVRRVRERGFEVRAVHCHLGSQITSAARYLAAVRTVLDFVVRLRSEGDPVEELNVGGGFGVPGLVRRRRGWRAERDAHRGRAVVAETAETFDMARLCAGLAAALDERGMLDELVVACEPGRYLVSDAFELLTRVVGVKRRSSGNWLILDGGLNLMPTAAMGERRRLRFPSRPDPERVGVDGYLAAIGGPLCYEGDVLMGEELVPEGIRAGDLVRISDAGAYTVSRGTNFNRARAPVVMREDQGTCREIWARETYEDIFGFSTGRATRAPIDPRPGAPTGTPTGACAARERVA